MALMQNFCHEKPRPFKNMLSHGIGEGSCYLNAGLPFLMASERLRELLKNLYHVDTSQSLSEENEVDVLAVTFAMAFSDTRNDVNYSNSEAMNPDIFNRLYYIRDGSTQQDACDLYERCLTNVLK